MTIDKFRFYNFRTYLSAKNLHIKLLKIINELDNSNNYFSSQLKRASLSVVLNIAEGSGKDSDKDFRRYIQNALGSINEVAACLDIAYEMGLIKKIDFDNLIDDCIDLKNQLGSFSKKLNEAAS
jgi:four helix bundle protein